MIRTGYLFYVGALLLSCSSIERDQVIGKWTVEDVKDERIAIVPDPELFQQNLNELYLGNILIIESDNRFKELTYGYEDTGEWHLKNNSIRLDYGDDGGLVYMIEIMNDSTMTLIDGELNLRLKKSNL